MMLTFWRSKQDNISCFDGEFLLVHGIFDAEYRQKWLIVWSQSEAQAPTFTALSLSLPPLWLSHVSYNELKLMKTPTNRNLVFKHNNSTENFDSCDNTSHQLYVFFLNNNNSFSPNFFSTCSFVTVGLINNNNILIYITCQFQGVLKTLTHTRTLHASLRSYAAYTN